MCSKEKIWLGVGIIISGGLYYYIHYYSQLTIYQSYDMQTQTKESHIHLSDMQTQTNESDIQSFDMQTQTNESDIQLVSVSVSPYTVISNILHKIQSEQTHILQELSKIQPDQPNKKREEEPKSIFLEEDINEDLNGYDNIPYHNMKKNTNTKNVWKIF
jgi:hypothetical protein